MCIYAIMWVIFDGHIVIIILVFLVLCFVILFTFHFYTFNFPVIEYANKLVGFVHLLALYTIQNPDTTEARHKVI